MDFFPQRSSGINAGIAKKHIHFPLGSIFLMAACLFMGNPTGQAMAADNPWNGIPDPLKHQTGALTKGQHLYATGMAITANHIRPDKVHELARKKSLLRALQLAYVFSSCRHLMETLEPAAQKRLEQMLLPLLGPVALKGTEVIRQWEEGRIHFTTVSVPLKSVEDLPCGFPDLSSVITRYLDSEIVTSEGLGFCLNHVSPYSSLGRRVRKRIGRWYEKQGLKALASCFVPSREKQRLNPQLEPFALQNRLSRAARLTTNAQKLAFASNWKNALALITRVLDLTPDYSGAYLVLADYFLTEEKKPAFAILAADQAFRDGTCLGQALSKTTAALKALQNPEAQLYDYLLSRLEPQGDGSDAVSLPVNWNVTLRVLEDGSVPYMVILSLGRVVAGAPQKPDPLYFEAQKGFMEAKTDHDLGKVVRLLMAACEKQPFSPETYNLLGACFRHLDRPTLALPFLWQALKLKPFYDYALTNLGLCCQKLGLMKTAGYYFEQDAVKESPTPWVRESYGAFKKAVRKKGPDPATTAE